MTAETIDPNKLTRGPIWHEQLSPSLVARISYLRDALYEVHPQSLDEWLDAFRRDAHPESEVRWWERLTRCYLTYSITQDLNAQQEGAAFRIIFKLGMGCQPEALDVDLATLPEGALEEIVAILGERTQ